MMNFSAEIKQAVTMQDVCSFYGFKPARTGFICCPFHSEKTPSLKIYENGKGYYCFGCGAGGDVIDFVMRLFNQSYSKAVEQINNDFCLGLPIGRKISLREKYAFKQKLEEQRNKILEEKQKKEELLNEFFSIYDKWVMLDKYLREYKPLSPDDEPNSLFIKALQEIEDVKFQLEDKETEVIMYAG